MSYRGDDLDLRTPQPQAGTGGERVGREVQLNGPHGVSDPIWVDDTVLACCNHAFDVAQAHRAGEVRIEHLLYALTRVDAAAEVLERFGVRDARLRRECATIIASEIPTGIGRAESGPRRSAELEEALRLAAEHGYRRNQPAAVEDLLFVFFEQKPELPGLEVLRRHMTSTGGDRFAPAGRPNFASFPSDAPRDTIRRTMAAGSPPGAGVSSVPERSGIGGTAADKIQNSRLDALEQMVRSLGVDLSSERQTFTGVLEGLQHDFGSLREQVVATGGSGGMSTKGIDAQLVRLSDRLVSIEGLLNSVRDSDGNVSLDLAPISGKLDLIEEALLGDDGAIARDGLAKLSADFSSLSQSIKEQGSATETLQATLSERLKSLSALLDNPSNNLEDVLEEQAKAKTNFVNELADVHDAIVKLNANQHALADSMSEWRKEGTDDRASISERLEAIDTANAETISYLKSLSDNMDSMYRVTVERYHRRNRFFYWLFGTDDWIGTSWPSQTAKIEDELTALKRQASE